MTITGPQPLLLEGTRKATGLLRPKKHHVKLSTPRAPDTDGRLVAIWLQAATEMANGHTGRDGASSPTEPGKRTLTPRPQTGLLRSPLVATDPEAFLLSARGRPHHNHLRACGLQVTGPTASFCSRSGRTQEFGSLGSVQGTELLLVRGPCSENPRVWPVGARRLHSLLCGPQRV